MLKGEVCATGSPCGQEGRAESWACVACRELGGGTKTACKTVPHVDGFRAGSSLIYQGCYLSGT